MRLTSPRTWALPGTVNGPGCLLDFGGGLSLAVFDRGLERGVVAFVLVGVGFGEVGDGLVELARAAEVGGQGDPVPGAGVRPRQGPPGRRSRGLPRRGGWRRGPRC